MIDKTNYPYFFVTVNKNWLPTSVLRKIKIIYKYTSELTKRIQDRNISLELLYELNKLTLLTSQMRIDRWDGDYLVKIVIQFKMAQSKNKYWL